MDSQATVLRADAERNGWVVVGEIRDADQRGWDDQRPGLLELYARCRDGSVDVVAFWSLSRLARSVRITENVVHELDRIGVALHSNQESWVAIPMMRQVMSAFNEQTTRDTQAHVRRAVRERTRRGFPHGPAPFGYVRGERGILEPGEHAECVRRIFQWRLEGCSLVDIAHRLHEAGILAPNGGRWSRPTLAGLLANPVYTGSVRLAEVALPDAHEAIVSAETFHMAQQGHATGRSRHPRTKPHRSWLEGCIVHACGAPMYLVGGSPGRPVLGFRCRVGGGWGTIGSVCPVQPRQIRADRAEALTWLSITDGLSHMRRPREIVRAARRRFREERPSAHQTRADAEARGRRVASQRARLLDLYVNSSYTRPHLDRELAKIEAEERVITALLTGLPALPDTEAIEAAWDRLRVLRDAAPLAPAEARGAILHALGVAVVSPAGVPIVRAGPGRREDAGRVTLRARPEFAGFFPDLDT